MPVPRCPQLLSGNLAEKAGLPADGVSGPSRGRGRAREIPGQVGCACIRAGSEDELACKPDSVPPGGPGAAAIHLGPPLPAASCGLPGDSGGQPSNIPCLTLLRVGFTKPSWSPRTLVVSYTTVSPLPAHRSTRAVCFLWHCPAGHPGWALPTTLPCGVRTFLGGTQGADAAARPARPRLSRIPRSRRRDHQRARFGAPRLPMVTMRGLRRRAERRR